MEPIETSAAPTFCAMCGGPIDSYATRIWREGRAYHSDCWEHRKAPTWHRMPYPLAVEPKAQIAEANHEAAAFRARIAELEAQIRRLREAGEQLIGSLPFGIDTAVTIALFNVNGVKSGMGPNSTATFARAIGRLRRAIADQADIKPDPRDELIARMRETLRGIRDFQTPMGSSFTSWYQEIMRLVNEALAEAAAHIPGGGNKAKEDGAYG